MLMSTTPTFEYRAITHYYGVVVGEAILGANIFKDMFAGIRDIVGIDVDYETVGSQGGMLMVSVTGTAVRVG